jgi:hypothetical protein
MSDSSDDMEFYSGMLDDDEIDTDDLLIKINAVLKYVEPHLDQMWAARVAGILLGGDFRDAKEHIKYYWEWAEEQGIDSNE